jgi:hypothetical protein
VRDWGALYPSLGTLSNPAGTRVDGDMIMGPKELKGKALPMAAAVLMALLPLWVVLTPAEERLGNLVRLVFIHGALVWVGLGVFSAAGALGLVALLVRRRVWYHGSQAAGAAALAVWFTYALSAVVVTGLTWGQWIAWGEPRVRATGWILIAATALAGVAWLVANRDFSAVVNVVMGVACWVVVRRAEVIRHPVDPIGTTESEAMRVFFFLIVLTVAGLAVILISWLWLRLQVRAERP